MLNLVMGEFVAGAADFMSYWLPLIAFMGTGEDNNQTSYIMLFKYRAAYATKDGAKKAARQELADILLEVAELPDITQKTIKILELAERYHYYPTPEYHFDWKKEWDINGFVLDGKPPSLH